MIILDLIMRMCASKSLTYFCFLKYVVFDRELVVTVQVIAILIMIVSKTYRVLIPFAPFHILFCYFGSIGCAILFLHNIQY